MTPAECHDSLLLRLLAHGRHTCLRVHVGLHSLGLDPSRLSEKESNPPMNVRSSNKKLILVST